MDVLRNLHLFIQVANHKSFSAAAKHFGLTPSAVSQRIALLEEDLETRLFFRTTRQIRLTAEGELLFAKAQQALDTVTEATDMLKDSLLEPTGVIRIHSMVHFGREKLIPMLAEFLENHPKVKVEVNFGDPSVDPAEEGFDVYVTGVIPRRANYVSKRLCRLPVVLVASPTYLARSGVPKSLSDLARHNWIRINLPHASVLPIELVATGANVGRRGDISPKRFVLHDYHSRCAVVGHVDAAINAALSGIGITAMTTSAALSFLRAGSLRVVMPQYRLNTYLDVFVRYPHRQYTPRKVRALIDFLVDKVARSPDLSGDLHEILPYAEN